MTKRFTRDNHTGYLYDNGEVVEDIMELLNSLNDENKELRVQLNFIRDQSNSFKRKVIEKNSSIGILKNEIEQLKSEIKDLNDVLARYEEKELKMND